MDFRWKISLWSDRVLVALVGLHRGPKGPLLLSVNDAKSVRIVRARYSADHWRESAEEIVRALLTDEFVRSKELVQEVSNNVHGLKKIGVT